MSQDAHPDHSPLRPRGGSSWPGTYIEELTALPAEIPTTPDDLVGFIGAASQGPRGVPVPVSDLAGYREVFGAPDAQRSPMDLSLQLFFDNGGTRAVVVRTRRTRARVGALPELAALAEVPVTILCLPGVTSAQPGPLDAALAFCRERGACCLVDTAPGSDIEATLTDAAGLRTYGAHGALYWPRLIMDGAPDEGVGASGAVAGLLVRTAAASGVWRAPAGTQADLRGVSALTAVVGDDDIGRLNTGGVNALRLLAGGTPVVWGARTLAGVDARASDVTYLPVRRLTDHITRRLRAGLAFASTEPTGPQLWARARSVTGDFLQRLHQQGAFPGATSRTAWFVLCDASLHTEVDLRDGKLNIVVGFAPLRPAEFVTVSITCLALPAG